MQPARLVARVRQLLAEGVPLDAALEQTVAGAPPSVVALTRRILLALRPQPRARPSLRLVTTEATALPPSDPARATEDVMPQPTLLEALELLAHATTLDRGRLMAVLLDDAAYQPFEDALRDRAPSVATSYAIGLHFAGNGTVLVCRASTPTGPAVPTTRAEYFAMALAAELARKADAPVFDPGGPRADSIGIIRGRHLGLPDLVGLLVKGGG